MNNRSFIHAAIVLTVGAVLAVGYYLLLGATNDTKLKAQSLATEILQKTKEHEQAGSLRETLLSVQEQEREVQGYFVPTEDIVPFLEELESLGSEFGASVSVVSVSDPDKTGKIVLSLSVGGTFDAVVRTIGIIEYGERAAAMRAVSLEAAEDGTWTASLTVTVLTPPSP